MAPVCNPPKTCFFGPSPQPKRHLDWFSHFAQLTAVSSCMPEHVLSLKNCAFAFDDLDTHLIDASRNPKWYLDRFSRFCTTHRYTLQRAAPFPLTIAPSHEGSEPTSNTWFTGPFESLTKTASRLVQPFLHSLRQCPYT